MLFLLLCFDFRAESLLGLGSKERAMVLKRLGCCGCRALGDSGGDFHAPCSANPMPGWPSRLVFEYSSTCTTISLTTRILLVAKELIMGQNVGIEAQRMAMLTSRTLKIYTMGVWYDMSRMGTVPARLMQRDIMRPIDTAATLE